jgi:hypothetical protein
MAPEMAQNRTGEIDIGNQKVQTPQIQAKVDGEDTEKN